MIAKQDKTDTLAKEPVSDTQLDCNRSNGLELQERYSWRHHFRRDKPMIELQEGSRDLII